MALSGMDIYKLLPKTNCRECGLATCIAFAMSLAADKIELSACPYVSDAVKEKLAQAEAPPIRPVTIGRGDLAFKIGGESVMFRHDKRFNNPTGLAMRIADTMADADVKDRLKRFGELRYQRMGCLLGADLLAIDGQSKDPDKFVALIEKITRCSDARLILMSDDPVVMAAGLACCAESKPLIYAATADNAESMAELAVKHACPLVAKAKGLAELGELSGRLTDAGVKEIVMDPGVRTLKEAFADQIHIRRAAIHQAIGTLSYPTITFPCEMTNDLSMETLIAATFIAKYAGIVVLSDLQGESLYPLLMERMALFSDPQEPMMTPEGVYAIGEPDRHAPLILASSWALTYYNLSLAAEVSRIPVFLCFERITEPDVMCWCHHCLHSTHKGKFVAENTVRFVKKCKLEERVDHRTLVISARNAEFKAQLENALPEWEIVVGPGEAVHLSGFLPELAEELRERKIA
ncbi:CO dehydrogenase/acetyl-CoA synthase (corrinoid Fe-S protein) [Desulfosarcina variabilis str. Montpellier]|uniref:acetyl-CoA decarbonylase/synthase complex subunit gamma n=1 Tax=Desulfosarcina variabilis TaxID=2300 RepID=UPI003AFA085E